MTGNPQLQSIDTFRSRRDRVLRISIVIAAVVFAMFGLKAAFAGATLRIFMAFLGCVLLYGAYIAQSHGRITISLSCFFLTSWEAFMGANLTFGSVDSPIMAWWVLFICMAGLLGGRIWALGWALVSCTSMALLWSLSEWSDWAKSLVVQENKTLQLRMHLLAQIFVSAAIVRSFLTVTDQYEQQVMDYVKSLETEVSRRTVAEDQALKSQKRSNQFFANMSHELRTPLNGILGFSSRLIKKTEGINEKTKGALETIHINGMNLSNLVNEIFEVSSLSAMELQISPEPLSLKNIVGDCVSEARISALEYGLTLNFKSEENSLVSADLPRLHQAILNVVYFGVRQTHSGGVNITQDCIDDHGAPWARIRFKDTSEGLEQEQLGSLFDSHYNFVLNSSKNLPISALALVISAKIIELHGGCITVSSRKYLGTTFTILLPKL